MRKIWAQVKTITPDCNCCRDNFVVENLTDELPGKIVQSTNHRISVADRNITKGDRFKAVGGRWRATGERLSQNTGMYMDTHI
jgi:hypothetical protein